MKLLWMMHEGRLRPQQLCKFNQCIVILIVWPVNDYSDALLCHFYVTCIVPISGWLWCCTNLTLFLHIIISMIAIIILKVHILGISNQLQAYIDKIEPLLVNCHY